MATSPPRSVSTPPLPPPAHLFGAYLTPPLTAALSCTHASHLAPLRSAASLGVALDNALARLPHLLAHLSSLARARSHASSPAAMLYAEIAVSAAMDAALAAHGTVGALVGAAKALSQSAALRGDDGRSAGESEVAVAKYRKLCFEELGVRLDIVYNGRTGEGEVFGGERRWPDVPQVLREKEIAMERDMERESN